MKSSSRTQFQPPSTPPMAEPFQIFIHYVKTLMISLQILIPRSIHWAANKHQSFYYISSVFQELLESIINDRNLFSLRFYGIAAYDLDRHGNYQKEKPEEEKKTSLNENSKNTNASKDSQLNYGYMSGAVGTLNLLFLAPSNESSDAEERIRKILEDRQTNKNGCVRKGCLAAFVEEELGKLQLCKPQKKKKNNKRKANKAQPKSSTRAFWKG